MGTLTATLFDAKKQCYPGKATDNALPRRDLAKQKNTRHFVYALKPLKTLSF